MVVDETLRVSDLALVANIASRPVDVPVFVVLRDGGESARYQVRALNSSPDAFEIVVGE